MEEKKVSNIIVIFIFILLCVFIAFGIFSALHKPVRKAPTLICKVRLHQLNKGCILYHNEYKTWPSKDNWCDLVKLYIDEEDKNVFQCPEDKTGPCSYAMNKNIPADANELPADLVILFESAPGWNQVGDRDDVVTDRHTQPGAHIVLAGQGIEFVPAEDIPTLRWIVED